MNTASFEVSPGKTCAFELPDNLTVFELQKIFRILEAMVGPTIPPPPPDFLDLFPPDMPPPQFDAKKLVKEAIASPTETEDLKAALQKPKPILKPKPIVKPRPLPEPGVTAFDWFKRTNLNGEQVCLRDGLGGYIGEDSCLVFQYRIATGKDDDGMLRSCLKCPYYLCTVKDLKDLAHIFKVEKMQAERCGPPGHQGKE